MIFVLIDDDPIANIIHEKIIYGTCGKIQVEVIRFTKAGDALEYLEGIKSSISDDQLIIFLDINMPVIDGWDFLKSLNERHLTSKVYILTSSVSKTDLKKAQCFDLVEDYVTKPLSIKSVKEILKNHTKI